MKWVAGFAVLTQLNGDLKTTKVNQLLCQKFLSECLLHDLGIETANLKTDGFEDSLYFNRDPDEFDTIDNEEQTVFVK